MFLKTANYVSAFSVFEGHSEIDWFSACRGKNHSKEIIEVLFLLVAAVIFDKAPSSEGHQIPNHLSINGSHHILQHSEAFTPFMFPMREALSFPAVPCCAAETHVSSKLTVTIVQKLIVSLLLFSLFNFCIPYDKQLNPFNTNRC